MLGVMNNQVKGANYRPVPRKLNQDNCESCFVQLRQHAGDNHNMSIEEVDAGMTVIRSEGLKDIIRS